MKRDIRRIVTGHDDAGAAIIGRVDTLTPVAIPSGAAEFTLVWTTATVPADNGDTTDGAMRNAGLTINGGSVIRVVDMLPGQGSPMHRSWSIDYGIVISGTLRMEMDSGETIELQAGDIVVQRGTSHLWHNPSPDVTCRIVFVLIQALPIEIAGKVLEEIHP